MFLKVCMFSFSILALMCVTVIVFSYLSDSVLNSRFDFILFLIVYFTVPLVEKTEICRHLLSYYNVCVFRDLFPQSCSFQAFVENLWFLTNFFFFKVHMRFILHKLIHFLLFHSRRPSNSVHIEYSTYGSRIFFCSILLKE